MDEFLKWLLRLSKPDLAVALLGIPVGAALDVWYFPGGTLDPFNTGLYFCAAAVGVKYAAESVRAWYKRRPQQVAEAKAGSVRSVSSRIATHEIQTHFNVVIGALASQDERNPADHAKCQSYKAHLEAQHQLWKAGAISDDRMIGDIRWGIEKYNDVITARRIFEENQTRTEDRTGDGPTG